MDREQIVRYARELAATCEKTLGIDPDAPDVVDDHLKKIGFCVDPYRATTEEAKQLAEFLEAFCSAWSQREAGGKSDHRVRDAADNVMFAIRMTLDVWHDEHSLVDEFWSDFSDYATVEDLDEYIRKKDVRIVAKLRRVANKYRSEAETEYQALEEDRSLRRRFKQLLNDWREGCRAIRAKAFRVQDENGGFRVVVENGLLVDVYALRRDAGETNINQDILETE